MRKVMYAFSIGMLLGLLIISPYLILWGVAILVRLLAERNIFWTIVPEPTAKAVMINGVVAFLLLSKMGFRFKGEAALTSPDTDVAEQWTVEHVQDQRHLDLVATGVGRYLPSFRGIHWIGLPPLADVYNYRFTWNSLETDVNEEGERKAKLKPSDKKIDYILLQEDVYAFELNLVECKDKIPLNAIILVSGYVTNPYRALFRIERWLEAVSNRVGAQMRDFFGTRSYEELVTMSGPTPADPNMTTPAELHAFFEQAIIWIERNWGFQISFIRIYSIDPGSKLAEDFIRATTVVYTETQLANAAVQRGRGSAAEDSVHFNALKDIPGAVDMFKWKSLRDSNVTTYVEGGGARPAINVGGTGGNQPNRRNPRGNPPASSATSPNQGNNT